MASHRMKTYSGESGIVYQYYFVESRPRRRFWGRGGTVFRFHVTSDRKNFFVAEVVVEDAALQAWEKAHGRALAGPERYAAAKMALFRAFDQSSRPEDLFRIHVRDAEIHSLLEPLHLGD